MIQTDLTENAQLEFAHEDNIVDQTPKTKWQANAVSDKAALPPDVQAIGSDQVTPLPQMVTPTVLPLSGSGTFEAGLKFSLGSKTMGVPFSEVKSPVAPVLLPPVIEAAEGYLELVTQSAVKLGVDSRMRREFAKKSLRLVKDLGVCTLSSKHEARRQMVLGQSLRLLRRYHAAARAFREASKYRGSRVQALMGLGWCQKRIGRMDLAVTTLTRALAIAPEDPRLHYNLACYLALSGQFRAAVYELAWALELEPSLRRRAVWEPDFDQLRSAPAFAALTSVRNSAK
jgi:tetratricopeptide (TPR) repeat protein